MPDRKIKLSIPRREPESLLPIGTQVRLRNCSSGVPGCVIGTRRNKIEVRWPDLNYVGRHGADGLILVEPKNQPESPRENPYSRLMRRLDEDNHRR